VAIKWGLMGGNPLWNQTKPKQAERPTRNTPCCCVIDSWKLRHSLRYLSCHQKLLNFWFRFWFWALWAAHTPKHPNTPHPIRHRAIDVVVLASPIFSHPWMIFDCALHEQQHFPFARLSISVIDSSSDSRRLPGWWPHQRHGTRRRLHLSFRIVRGWWGFYFSMRAPPPTQKGWWLPSIFPLHFVCPLLFALALVVFFFYYFFFLPSPPNSVRTSHLLSIGLVSISQDRSFLYHFPLAFSISSETPKKPPEPPIIVAPPLRWPLLARALAEIDPGGALKMVCMFSQNPWTKPPYSTHDLRGVAYQHPPPFVCMTLYALSTWTLSVFYLLNHDWLQFTQVGDVLGPSPSSAPPSTS